MFIANALTKAAREKYFHDRTRQDFDAYARANIRCTRMAVSVELGIHRVTLAKRESKGRISREAWLALCALPEKPV